MNNSDLLYNEIRAAFIDKSYLQKTGFDRSMIISRDGMLRDLAASMLEYADDNGRIRFIDVLDSGAKIIPEMSKVPEGGWAQHCYKYILGILFPHLAAAEDHSAYEKGRATALMLLRAVHAYESKACSFDPTLDMTLLSDSEVHAAGYTEEYIRMRKLSHQFFIYEFMRLGSEITPFNTLGHICGVHYIATLMACQLRASGIPVDIALASGAAASHDIGKYGCRKSEERRVPYLHYYYTDYCMSGNGMPDIAHIAANHSTWDLVFENLSVESLLLIYADFRIKSTRDADGKEIIRFYTLAEAFDVILGKLDNVDEAKRKRYEKVYSRLKDFEDFMILQGVVTDMPAVFSLQDGVVTELPDAGSEYDFILSSINRKPLSLLTGDEITDAFRMSAVEHNILMMHDFSDNNGFAKLIETARSEKDWKNLRTYITIIGEYSAYMTESQKALALKFLYDQLTHKESDIREQAARQMGQMVSTFRQSYRKELPEDIPKLDETTTNLAMFSMYLEKILYPSSKLADQHRRWIIQSMDFFVGAALEHCAGQFAPRYLDILADYYRRNDYDAFSIMSVLCTPLAIMPDRITAEFRDLTVTFANNTLGRYDHNIDLLALELIRKLEGDTDGCIAKRAVSIMGVPASDNEHGFSYSEDILSSMFLDDLKFQTSWIRKIANIRYMTEAAEYADQNVRLHIATHLVNLIKNSETVTVRRNAGNALLKIIPDMSADQKNEILVELSNGLEIEDYQFSRLIPDYLGVILLALSEREFNEAVTGLEGYIGSGAVKTASAAIITASVALRSIGSSAIKEQDHRASRLIKIMMKGLAHYKGAISREAFRVFSENIFGCPSLSYEDKRTILSVAGKRLLTLIPGSGSESTYIEFCSNAAALKNIYRFISDYLAANGSFDLPEAGRIAFFPGTFDPFSLGHKAIARTIRDMGFEVYLALDEFSWSKKTLPHMLRKEIISMSIAGEPGIYIFPDHIPVNIANPADLGRLREIFDGRKLYIAVGSDVIRNASSYKAMPSENSIHGFNHIVFARQAKPSESTGEEAYPVRGDVINLTLRKYYEDISSTRIRENIDLGRDISNLIDPVVQNYIYENNLYVRQPAYKHEIQARDIRISDFEHSNHSDINELRPDMEARGYDWDALQEYLSGSRVRTVYIEGRVRSGKRICAFASSKRIERHDLLSEFGDTEITKHIRAKANGAISVIGALYFGKSRNISNLGQMMLTEILTDLLAKDYGYVVYHPVDKSGLNPATLDVLKRQGFVNISSDHGDPVYAVDLNSPIVIFRDVETVIKAPLNKNPRIMKAVDEAHNRLLRTFCELYPGRLILSFNTSAVYSKIVEMVAAENKVSTVPDPLKRRGPYMAVPFGKALSDVVVPNTVTKALRTEKYVSETVRSFDIRESIGYAGLDDQAMTLRSFNREVILIDDLLHSGQRMRRIDPLLRKHDVRVRKIIVGLLTGNARDDMAIKNRDVEGAYFIPEISMWLNERDCYPFIGGDSLETGRDDETSINLILPYTSFSFAGKNDADMVFKYSMTCLENARDIMKVIEEEYQEAFEMPLTLGKLGAVITHPRRPDYGAGLKYDESVAPSVYIESDIKRAERLHLLKNPERRD